MPPARVCVEFALHYRPVVVPVQPRDVRVRPAAHLVGRLGRPLQFALDAKVFERRPEPRDQVLGPLYVTQLGGEGRGEP